MNKHLAGILIGLVVVAGCHKSIPESGPVVEIPAGSFAQGWRAELPLIRGNAVTSMQVLGDLLLVYTKNNTVYAINAGGGQVLWSASVAKPTDELREAVMFKDLIVFPTTSTLEVYNSLGTLQRSVNIGHAIRSDLATVDEFVYVGLDYSYGGRLAKLDTTRKFAPTDWELMTGAGVSASPVWKDSVLFVGGEDGAVYAVNEDRAPVWSIPGHVFKTGGRILADLVADDYALFVASTDTRLYAIDRNSGKIRWQFYAGQPLLKSPFVTEDSVYQYVPRSGVVAMNKTEGKFAREPRWTAPDARAVLSADANDVYVLTADKRIAALDKTTGEQRFISQREDLSIYTAKPQSPTIFAASPEGLVISVKPVHKPGQFGELVQADNGLTDCLVALR